MRERHGLVRALRGLVAAALAHALLAAAPAAGDPSTEVAVAKDVPAGGSDVALELCPPGENALGGGTALENVAFMRVTETAPTIPGTGYIDEIDADSYETPDGWVAAGSVSSSHRPADVTVGAVCVDASAETVVAKATVPADSTGSATAVCPSGKTAVAGGFGVGNIGAMEGVSSAPLFGPSQITGLVELAPGTHARAPTAWEATVRNEDDQSREIGVAAICTDSLEVSSVEVVEGTVEHGAFENLEPVCPEGAYAVGGAVEPVSDTDMAITEISPRLPWIDGSPPSGVGGRAAGSYPPPHGWELTLYHEQLVTQEPVDFKAAAICVPEPSQRALAAAALAGLSALAAGRRRAPAPGRRA